MTDELNSKFLKLSLNDSKVDADVGNNVVLKRNTETAKTVLKSLVGEGGLENCLKLDEDAAAATSVYVAAKSIENKWPWVKITNVIEDNVLEVQVAKAKDTAFQKILQSGQLERAVKENFESLDTNLEGILKEKMYEEHGESVYKLIQDVRVSAIEIVGDESQAPTVIVAGSIVEGTYNVQEEDCHRIVADVNGESSCVVGTIIKRSGNVTGTKKGLKEVILRGPGYDIGELTRNQNDRIRVTVSSDLFDVDFTKDFKPTDVVRHVRNALEKARPGNSYQITRNGELLDEENLTIAQAGYEGSMVNWKAIKR